MSYLSATAFPLVTMIWWGQVRERQEGIWAAPPHYNPNKCLSLCYQLPGCMCWQVAITSYGCSFSLLYLRYAKIAICSPKNCSDSQQVSLVDEFLNPKTGRSSHCYRLVYRHMEKTFTQEEVNSIHRQIESRAAEQLGVEIRWRLVLFNND